VFVEVAKRLRMKVHVKDAAYNVYKNIAEIREAVTDDPSCTRIHACLGYVSVVVLLLYKIIFIFLWLSKKICISVL
jgi:hypothetical protein